MSAQVALVTGCSSGIGFETAVRLAERGWRVYAGLHSLERSGALDREIETRGLNIVPLALDVTDAEQVERAIRVIRAESSRLTALVNNAGINIRGFFEDLTEAELRRVFEVNLFGTVRVTRAVLPLMRAAGGGRIVMVSSTGAILVAPGSSAYCASKFSLEGFTESLSLEVSPFGIQVSLIEPGFVETDLFRKNRCFAKHALSPDSLYRDRLERLEAATDQALASSRLTSRAVADTIHAVLVSPAPRLRYVTGWRARLLIALKRRLPEAWFDRVWYRAIQKRLGGASKSPRVSGWRAS